MSKTFDGMTIDEWGGRFSGTFDLDEDQASRHSVDDVVVLVVRAQVKGANVKTTPQGDVKRLHLLGVEEVVIPSTKLWKQCMSELRSTTQGKLELVEPSSQNGLEASNVIEVEEIEDVLKYVNEPTPDPMPVRGPQPIPVKDDLLREFLNS